jgi:hypothetical protein
MDIAPREKRPPVILENHRDIAGRPGPLLSRHGNRALRRLDETGHQPQHRGLSATGRADHATDRSTPDPEADIRENKVATIPEADSIELDDRLTRHDFSPPTGIAGDPPVEQVSVDAYGCVHTTFFTSIGSFARPSASMTVFN